MEEEKKPDEENKEGMMMEAAPAMEWINMINVPFQYVSTELLSYVFKAKSIWN